jgi:hypothetical protein
VNNGDLTTIAPDISSIDAEWRHLDARASTACPDAAVRTIDREPAGRQVGAALSVLPFWRAAVCADASFGVTKLTKLDIAASRPTANRNAQKTSAPINQAPTISQ